MMRGKVEPFCSANNDTCSKIDYKGTIDDIFVGGTDEVVEAKVRQMTSPQEGQMRQQRQEVPQMTFPQEGHMGKQRQEVPQMTSPQEGQMREQRQEVPQMTSPQETQLREQR